MIHSMSQVLQKPYFQSLSSENRFRALTEEFCAQAEREGLRILPHREVAWERFRTFSIEDQLKKVSSFETYFRACASAVEGGLDLRDGVGLFQRVTQSLGLRIPKDFSGQLKADDVVEIYSKDFTQIFRNLRFLEVCSYSLAELYAFEFPELYRRPAALTQKIVDAIQGALHQEEPKTVSFGVPDHFLEEVFSPGQHKFFIQQGVVAPVMDSQDQTVGFVATLSATLFRADPESDFDASKVRPLSH